MMRFAALVTLLALAPCTDMADTFPMNNAVDRMGTIRVDFVRQGIGRGRVTITMAD